MDMLDRRDYDRIHGFGERNEDEKWILDFASAFKLAILNIYFRALNKQ